MRKAFRIIILIIAIFMLVFSGYKLYGIYSEYREGSKLYDDFADKYISIEDDDSGNKENKDDPKAKDQSSNTSDTDDISKIDIDFESLLRVNEDVVGWIYNENTPINYPIVQAGDNDYYLYRMIDKNYNGAGSIFMDYRNNKDFSDLNTLIYGHNMKNDSMFGTLSKYQNQEYYEEHPVIYIITPDQSYHMELMAGFVTPTSANIYSNPQTQDELETLYEDQLWKVKPKLARNWFF